MEEVEVLLALVIQMVEIENSFEVVKADLKIASKLDVVFKEHL